MGAARKIDPFHAIAEPSRRRILELLRTRERTSGDLAGEFGFTWAALSQHLRVLRGARLVSVRRSGRQMWYRINPGPLVTVCDPWIHRHTDFWKGRLSRLKDYAERKPARRRRRG